MKKDKIVEFDYMDKTLKNGTDCPHCGRGIILYHRKISKSIAKSLLIMVQKQESYFNAKYLPASDFAIVRYWGLAEQEANLDNTKRNSGNWKLTYKGVEYAYNRLTVPKYCYLFDDTIIGFSEERATIGDCIDFDYKTIFGGS